MILRRFTSLPLLLDILESSELQFSDPRYWEDKNDSEILKAYKDKKKLKTLFALCFTKDTETIYQWKAFSDNSSGCFIKFDSDNINKKILKNRNIRQNEIKYIKINELKQELKKIEDIPFSKRWPYRNENEYRYIYESKLYKSSYSIPINSSDIISVTFNQKMTDHTFDTIKRILKNKYKMSNIYHSTVYRNETWLNYIRDKMII
ncbi:MAG: hypothetical protein ACYC1A_10825 [Spirochaetales bacterium]